MATRQTGRKIKALAARPLSTGQARAVKGGGYSPYVNYGDIKGEKQDRSPLPEMMMPKR